MSKTTEVEELTLSFLLTPRQCFLVKFAIADIQHIYNFVAQLWRSSIVSMVLFCLVPSLIIATLVYGPAKLWRMIESRS